MRKIYHPNIEITIELKSRKILDNKRTNISGSYKLKCEKSIKLPSSRASKTLNCYDRNTINGDLYCSKII